MNIFEKQALTRLHDDSLEACARRFRAARILTGLTQEKAGAEAGVKLTAWNNAERARNFPPLRAIRWLYRAHRIDYNFILAGEFAQLPGDVQPAIFAALEQIGEKSELDQKPNSD